MDKLDQFLKEIEHSGFKGNWDVPLDEEDIKKLLAIIRKMKDVVLECHDGAHGEGYLVDLAEKCLEKCEKIIDPSHNDSQSNNQTSSRLIK